MLDKLKGELGEASVRVEARNMVLLAKEPLAAYLAKNIDKKNASKMKKKILEFFETDIGSSFVEFLVATGTDQLPFKHKKLQEITKEIRVQAMTRVGDQLADIFMGPLRNVIATAIAGEDVNFDFTLNSGAKTLGSGDKNEKPKKISGKKSNSFEVKFDSSTGTPAKKKKSQEKNT